MNYEDVRNIGLTVRIKRNASPYACRRVRVMGFDAQHVNIEPPNGGRHIDIRRYALHEVEAFTMQCNNASNARVAFDAVRAQYVAHDHNASVSARNKKRAT